MQFLDQRHINMVLHFDWIKVNSQQKSTKQLSRIAAAFAFIGSIVGIAMAYMLGADYQEIIQGLWGYNPALGAMVGSMKIG